MRYKTRELADDILASSVKGAVKDDVAYLEVLDSFLEVAKAQNWVKQDELLEIQNSYANIKRDIERSGAVNPSLEKEGLAENQSSEKHPEAEFRENKKMPERQERILAFLREQGRIQVWQAKEILPEVTKRTLRRDFESLLKRGLVERIGERNNTFYQIKTA
ncbi:MAG: hypothetical protein G01um101430_289 [Parcubacteria group bacterium Gr01-1014_30]|nr:MAG: hypothetical protein G01um101430_289 [Parcubacteria group bacterium Gr01-1014_30]